MKTTNRKIGFSHGCTFKLHEPYSSENIDIYKRCGCNAIEVKCHSSSELPKLNNIVSDLEGFDYISLHLPCIGKYKEDDSTNHLLETLEKYYKTIQAKLAVIHPDQIEDWSIFDRFSSMNWGVENTDDKSQAYKSVEEFKKLFEIYPHLNLVLDVGHCNANDKSMKLAGDFIEAFKDRIKQIHLSGYNTFHEPLFKTQQTQIIEMCKKLDAPIIIESTFEKSDGDEGVAREYDYILSKLQAEIGGQVFTRHF